MTNNLSRRGTQIVKDLTDHVTERFRDGVEHVTIPWETSHAIDGDGDSRMSRIVYGATLDRLAKEFPNARYGEYYDTSGFVNGTAGDNREHQPRYQFSPVSRMPGCVLALLRVCAFLSIGVSIGGLVYMAWILF